MDDDDDEDELQAKIAEEHSKFLEQQRSWQEQRRASRPWSAPPLMSPRPESQRVKMVEAARLALPEGECMQGCSTSSR